MNMKAQQRGFSLIELVMALSITVVLTGTAFYFLKQNQESFVVEAAKADLQQNFRAAMDLMTREIQGAGSGMPQFMGPVAGLDGGTDGSGNPTLDAGGRQLTDEIFILYGDPSFPSLSVSNEPIASRTSTIQVTNPSTGAPTFTNGAAYVIYALAQANVGNLAAADANFDVFTLASSSAISGGMQLTANATATVNPPAWTGISFPSTATALRVGRLREWVRYRLSPTTNTLQRQVNGGTWVDVARNISNLQIQYWTERVDTTTNPATVTSAFVDQPGTALGNNRAIIRSVRITITAQTQMAGAADGQGQRVISQTIEVTPRNLVLPGFVINR